MTWRLPVFVIGLFALLLYVGWLGKTKRDRALTLTHRERVSMCNAKGMLFSDGVCQRIYINMCRPAPTPCKRE